MAKRRAMTLIEVTVAIAILGVLAVIVAQTIVWSLREKTRIAAHQAALELAANTLESARAQPWQDLTQKWADALAIPIDMTDLLPGGKIACKVESGHPNPHGRRVNVKVSWNLTSDLPDESVQLNTVLSERTTAKKGTTP